MYVPNPKAKALAQAVADERQEEVPGLGRRGRLAAKGCEHLLLTNGFASCSARDMLWPYVSPPQLGTLRTQCFRKHAALHIEKNSQQDKERSQTL